MRIASNIVIWTVAAFYAYGTLVHILNMASLTGFEWAQAPSKWQALDIIYLVLDITVATGLMVRWRIGYVSFYIAALSQILLYTVFRSWIVDVPEEFSRTPEELSYLDSLVWFHILTLILVTAALWQRASSAKRSN